jgi:hypothetical protein
VKGRSPEVKDKLKDIAKSMPLRENRDLLGEKKLNVLYTGQDFVWLLAR